ncbi:hypothetical protein ACP275_09G041600 [Erythranthe tilingii]
MGISLMLVFTFIKFLQSINFFEFSEIIFYSFLRFINNDYYMKLIYLINCK